MARNIENTRYPAMQYRRFRRFVWHTVRTIVRLLFRLDYQGLENMPAAGPAILVGNHTSMADMLVINTAVDPWICWVAKKELFSRPLTRSIYTRLGCIPVDRDKTDLLAARGIYSALRTGLIVGMFPQGTRVRPSRIPFVRPRSGAVHFAVKTGVPILPVAIDGRFRIFGKVRIVFGPPIDLGLDPRSHLDPEKLHDLTVEVMRQVYALIGQKYHLAPPEAEP